MSAQMTSAGASSAASASAANFGKSWFDYATWRWSHLAPCAPKARSPTSQLKVPPLSSSDSSESLSSFSPSSPSSRSNRNCGTTLYSGWLSMTARACVSRSANRSPDHSPVNRLPSEGSWALPQSEYWRTEFHKACWSVVSTMPLRTTIMPLAFPDTVCYFDPKLHPQVKGKIALTIDDAPCRNRNPDNAMVQEVLDLLKEYDAHATFFLCTDYANGYEDGLRQAIAEGHEVANHCPEDRSYADEAEADFEAAFLKAESVCESLRAGAKLGATQMPMSCATSSRSTAAESSSGSEASATPSSPSQQQREPGLASKAIDALGLPSVRWFRAPHAKLSAAMRRVIDRHGFTHVLCDCYANDPWINDADYIAKAMLDSALDGSVAVIHMPERGFREYNFLALRKFLQGLKDRQFRAVSLTHLHAEAQKPASAAEATSTTSS